MDTKALVPDICPNTARVLLLLKAALSATAPMHLPSHHNQSSQRALCAHCGTLQWSAHLALPRFPIWLNRIAEEGTGMQVEAGNTKYPYMPGLYMQVKS